MFVAGARFQGLGHTGGGVGDVGLWPSVFNVAAKALVSANATCGSAGREEFCRLSGDGPGGRGPRCGVCDLHSADPHKRHPPEHAIDGTSRWWQSPTRQQGQQYQAVAFTVDLKQVSVPGMKRK